MAAGQALENELGHSALEKKLAAAGIGSDVDRTGKVMERIRARQAKPTEPGAQ